MEKIAIERNIWIAASRERVWRAITDPKQMEQWFSPGTPWTLTALAVGGRLFVQGPDSELYVQVIESLDPPHQIVMRSQPEPPETPYITIYTLEEENGGTRLKLSYSGYEQLPDELRRKRLDQDGGGFSLMLENLSAYVDGRPLPNPQGF